MSGEIVSGDEDRSAALRQAWDECLHMLAPKVGKVTLDSYIRPARPVSYQGNTVTIGVESSFAREWLERKYANQIRSALEFHLDTSGLQIAFTVLPRDPQRSPSASKSAARKTLSVGQTTLPLDTDEEQPAPACTPVLTPSLQIAAASARPPAAEARLRKREPAPPCLPIDEKLTFANYLEDRANKLAKVSAMKVAENPGQLYNPLFIYGGPGLGKSHLLQAIALSIRQNFPAVSLSYISGELFTQRYFAAIRDHTTEVFRRQFRGVDVWLVDDIQFIAGKDHTKEEFYHTFSTLYQSGKQIVITSDRSPRDLHALDERLRSRFQSGLIADVSAPEISVRIQFLERLAHSHGAAVDSEIIHYIADAIQSNMRTLEGALTRLIAFSSIMNVPMSPELAQTVLSEYFIDKPIRTRIVTIDEIVTAVCEQFAVTVQAVKGRARNKEFVLPRHVALYLCRRLLPELGTEHIGAAFGRDHTSVLYACQRVSDVVKLDTDLNLTVGRLIDELSQERDRRQTRGRRPDPGGER